MYVLLMGAAIVASMVVSVSLGTFYDPTTLDSPMVRQAQAKSPPKSCIFEDSELYRSIYVYPSPNEPHWKTSELVNEYGKTFNESSWPWIEFDDTARKNSRGHYNINSQNVQYTTELLVRELMVNPDSCLRTNDPETAKLFYVPYLPSIEHHKGTDRETDYSTSPYGQSIMNILEMKDYTLWEER